MRERLLQFLRCPNCARPLALAAYANESDDVVSGLLTCSCGEWYPLIRGIPRVLRGDLRRDLVVRRNEAFFSAHGAAFPDAVRGSWERDRQAQAERRQSLERRTAESFAFEWKTFHRLFDAYRMNFLQYIAPLDESFFRGKLVLDAGCGQGRHAYWAAKFGAEVIALDLGDAVEAAKANCQGLPVHVVQADLRHPPFAPATFEYVFSIGVLHHLPNPREGFLALVPFVKPGGLLSIWVYGRRHNARAIYFYEPLRRITNRLPRPILKGLTLVPAAAVEGLNLATKFLERLVGHRVAERIPFSYYANFPFAVKWNDAFDVLATPKSTYWTEEQIHQWFQDAQLERITILPLRRSSIKGFGYRPL